MSYSITSPCSECINKDKCNDLHFIEGAVQGIHSVFPSEKGHLGSGNINIDCSNYHQQ